MQTSKNLSIFGIQPQTLRLTFPKENLDALDHGKLTEAITPSRLQSNMLEKQTICNA
jgi:hypothetical protein